MPALVVNGTKKRRLNNESPMDDEDDEVAIINSGNQNNEAEFDELDHISDDEEGGVRIGDIYIPPAPKPALTFDANGPRLLITQIVNENFKSYYGVQTLGPFHKCFTAIIGPNGSGKSNVIDSMLFVFGYRAAKIRSKKISVLIHSSSKHPNVPSASVAVHFCQIIDKGEEDYDVVPGSEIVVSRTCFKDNSSFYQLNGRRVQFKEVAKMLRSFGIDLDHNRFLILQGEVEQIAMMKPKAQTEHESGMLEYLEDIIGTSRYKEPIDKLSARVEEYSEMRKEKLNRVRLAEQEKAALEGPMRQAVEVMGHTNAALRTRNTLLQKYIHETKKIIADKQAEMLELTENVARIDEKLNSFKEQIAEKTTELKAGMKKYDDFRKEKEEIAEKLSSCKKKTVSVIADTTQGNKKKKNLEQLLEQEKGKLIDLEQIPERNKREIKDCEKLLAKHTESKRKADEEQQAVVASVRSTTRGLQEEKDKLRDKLMVLKRAVDEAKNQYKVAEAELKIYLSTETVEAEKLQNMKESYEKANRDLESKTAQQQQLEIALPNHETELSDIQSQLHNIKSEEAGVAQEARALRSQLEESRQMMTASRSRNRVLDRLMQEKRNGNIPGIFGRLGDLGGIDTKYDVAISTCCGALDNIVVDTVETAQACVQYLRTHDIGRATFIALDKQEHLKSKCERRDTYPENAPRLFDLIRVNDSRVLPAFYYALRDTLVASDLEQASRIAYGHTRYRVVTLKGDVIEIAGTMSGGGKTTMRGRMASSVQQNTSEQDPEAVRASEARLQQLEERLSELRATQSRLGEMLVSLQRSTRDGKTTLHKLNVELRSLAEQLPVLENQMHQQESLVANCTVDPRQKASLEKVLKTAQDKLDKATHEYGEVEKSVHGIDAQIAAAAGDRVKDAQKLVNDLAKKIAKVSGEVTKLNVAINTSVRNAKKSKEKISQMEADLKETEKNLEKLANEKKQLSLDTTEYTKQVEQLEEQISEGSGEFSGLKEEIAKLQTKENKYKAERLEAGNAVSKMEKTIHDCTSKMPMWEKELRGLKLEDPGVDGLPGLERPEPLETHSTEQLEETTVDELRNRLAAQNARLGDAKPNPNAILDYKAKEELYIRRAAELDEITTKRNEMRALYDQLKKKRTTDFLCGFNTITTKLKEMYQMITLGGDAELELVDSLDPFTEGIIFSVRPPNKSWKNISNLSGGEKTLSSLALVFALHYYKPTPLYVMDEIDAALDFKNVSIVANYIKERTKNAQFIIISLRYNMFEACNRLVGIYKTDDCTKSVSVENKLPAPAETPVETENPQIN